MAVIGITGSTYGIGRATVRVLLAEGTSSWFTHAVGSGASPSRKHWVATSLWWLATWRGLMNPGWVKIRRIADGTIVERWRSEGSSRSRARSRICGSRTRRR
jgi:hypothetical protein